jgi:hypothetical protein
MTPNLFKKLLLPSLVVWLVPLVVSFAFYDANGNLTGNFWIFKLTMVLVSCLTSWLAFRRFYKNSPTSSPWTNSLAIILVQVVLDLAVLIGVFRMPLVFYISIVLPVYVIFIPLVNYLLAKKILK